MNLIVKKIKETEKEYKHDELWYGNNYLGYCIKNISTLSHVDENWNFVSKSELPYFHAKTKKELFVKAEELAIELLDN